MRTFQQFSYGQIDALGASLARELWAKQPAWAVASISEADAAFLAGLVIATRPRKLVEVGVASGWGSCVLFAALRAAGLDASEIHGVDIAERFFYDAAYATGQCVRDVLPAELPRYRLLTGVTMGECAPTIGAGVDLAFIDAHHMHPWATLDLLAMMPFVTPGSWIAMHDLNLSRKEDQEHRNRGPKYLFEGWDGDKAHSIQEPTMAGAIRLSDDPAANLPLLLDILYTPWELTVDRSASEAVCAIVEAAYGKSWSARFRRAVEVGNYHVSKVNSAEIDSLQKQIATWRAKPMGWARSILRARNR